MSDIVDLSAHRDITRKLDAERAFREAPLPDRRRTPAVPHSVTGLCIGDAVESAKQFRECAGDTGYTAVPYVTRPAPGGKTWICDPIGTSATLFPDMPMEMEAGRWRLLGSRAAIGYMSADARRELDYFERTLEAAATVTGGDPIPLMLSGPAPWTLLRRLLLPNGSLALSDPGARRDILESYCVGIVGIRDKVNELTGTRVRFRLVEHELADIHLGRVPTVSGYQTLPAIGDQEIIESLARLVSMIGDDPIISFSDYSALNSEAVKHTLSSFSDSIGLTSMGVPLTSLDMPGWESIAELAEAGKQSWILLPAHASDAPDEVMWWVNRIVGAWDKVGMDRADLLMLGILGGEELPVGPAPVMPAGTSEERMRGHAPLARNVAAALTDIASGASTVGN